MQETMRLVDGRCTLVAHTSTSNDHTVNLITPEGLCAGHNLRNCDVYRLWHMGLFLEQTDGFRQFGLHGDYDANRLREDLRSFSTLLGQGVSLLTHLNQGNSPTTWEAPDAKAARGIFRDARTLVDELKALVKEKRGDVTRPSKQVVIDKPARDITLTDPHSCDQRKPSMPNHQDTPKREPIHKLTTEGPCRAAVWLHKNEATNEDFYTVSFYRYYRDRQSQWQTSTTFRAQDLPNVARLAHEAQQFIEQRQTMDQKPQQQCPEPEPNKELTVEL